MIPLGFVQNTALLHDWVHRLPQVKAGTLSVGSEVVCKVDYERRANVAPNHTMTHVLNFALRKVGWIFLEQERARLCSRCTLVI